MESYIDIIILSGLDPGASMWCVDYRDCEVKYDSVQYFSKIELYFHWAALL